jgi:cation transport regulator ChaB
MSDIRKTLTWNRILERLRESGAKIQIPEEFSERVDEIDKTLDNDKTGLISTVYEFMVSAGTVNFNIVTDNKNLDEILKRWANTEVNKNISNEIPRGFKGITEQFLRERWRSSFIIAKIEWEKFGDYELPSKIWFLESQNVTCDNNSSLNKRTYAIPLKDDKEEKLKDKENITYILRKPFNQWKESKATPYLVKKGVLYNALLKSELKSKQADILEEIIPYLLILKAGDRNLVQQNLLGDLDKQLTDLKDSIRKYKRDHEYRANRGDSTFKARYDVELQHFLPELEKVFNEEIIRPLDLDMLYGLGLIELQGFGTRQEAIMNPKVLFEEIVKAVGDLTEFYAEIMAQVVDRNLKNHPKYMTENIRVLPGVIKATLTDAIKKLVKDYANTGQLSIEDSFEVLPTGFDFSVNRTRRIQERDNGDEDLFFPRVILNQNSDDYPTRPNITPQEVPQKKKKKEKADATIVKCRYCETSFNLNEIPEKSMGATECPSCHKILNNADMINAEQEAIEAPYTKTNYPPQLKNLPVGARTIWIRTFNSIYNETKDEDKARQGAWKNVKLKYKKVGDKWMKKEKASTIDELPEEIKAVLSIPEQIQLVKE